MLAFTPADYQRIPRLVDVRVRGRRALLVVGGPDCSQSMETVGDLAAQLGKTPEVLLGQFRAAGVLKEGAESRLNENDKQKLLDHLRGLHGAGERKRITLVKKGITTGEPSISRKVSVEQTGADGTAPASTVNRTILVSHFGGTESWGSYQNALLHAFCEFHGRRPVWHESERLKPYEERLEAVRRAVKAGEPSQLFEAVRQCFDGADSQLSWILERVVLNLIADRFGSIVNAQVSIAWAWSITRRALRKSESASLRNCNTAAALAAWRLKRYKRLFPSCVATISLK